MANSHSIRRWAVAVVARAFGVSRYHRPLRILLPTTTTNFDFPKSVETILLDIRAYRSIPIWTAIQRSSAMLSLAISQTPFTAVLLLLFAARRLEAKSVIVDDSDTSRITYSSGWSIGNNCTGCYAEPDPTQPSNGTWHEYV